MLAFIARARRVAERAIDWAAIAVFAGIFACMFVQVILRYAFDSPLTWSEELARYLMIWCAFLGWVIASRHGTHLAMTFVVDKAPRRTRAAARIGIEAATILFAWVLGRRGLQLAVDAWDIENVAVPFNLGIVYLIEPVAAIAIALYAVGNLFAALREIFSASPAAERPVTGTES